VRLTGPMPVVRRLPRLVAAAALAAAAGVVLPASPSSAATCSGDTGVSVVVDFTKLGGGIATGCVTDGGGDTAASLFEVDHDLTRVQQYPGAVCKVDNTPADAACQNMPPTDAYWGLFWSDGSGGWVYSSEGVDSLNVPDGGSVAFAWQDGGDRDYPGVAAPQTADEPSPSPSPSPTGGGSGGGSGGSSSGSRGSGGASHPTTDPGGTTAPSPTASGSTSGATGGQAGSGDPGVRGGHGGKGGHDGRGAKHGGKGDRDGKGDQAGEPGDTPSASPTDDPGDDPSDAVPVADPPSADDGGLPAWVAPAGIAALFGVAGVVALVRKRAVR